MPQRKSVAVENQDAFFETRNGTPFSKDHVRQKLASVLLKLGLKRGGLHAFVTAGCSSFRKMVYLETW
jgi:hypothetical protein